MIVPGSRSQILASRVSSESGVDLATVEQSVFPDGEQLISVEDLSDEVYVIASTPTDASYIELLQILDACRESAYVNLVIPYMGYARQDKSFNDGEAVTSRVLAEAISPYVDSVHTLNIHNTDVLRWFDSDTKNHDASPLIGRYFRDKLEDPLVVSPDEGAVEMAMNASKEIDCDYDYLEKDRLSGSEVRIEPKEFSVEGRDVLLIDDIISTGGTMTEAVEILGGQGASSVLIGCVHPVFTGRAVDKLFSAGATDVVATDTLSTSLSMVSVSELISDRIIN